MGERVRLTRFPRPLRVLGVVAVIGVGLGGSFLVGRFLQPPSSDALIAAQKPIVVTAEVESRVIDDTQVFAGKVDPGANRTVPATGVVTRAVLSPGDRVGAGTFLGKVSGTPLISLPGPLPLYRDLAMGDEGEDVQALQQAFAAAGQKPGAGGKVDWATFTAARNLLTAAGSDLPWGSAIPAASFVPAPRAGAVVLEAAPVGTHVGEDEPFMVLQVGQPTVTFRADAVTAADLAVGDSMSVRLGSATFEAAVASIGEFEPGEAGIAPGRTVVLTSSDSSLLGASADSSAVVSPVGQATEPVLSVPITALRQDDKGDYVEVDRPRGGAVALQRCDVLVLRTGGGWVGISTDDDLRSGDLVRVE